ncbi:MAG: hypothetical protein M0T85_01875 [Dehalococcoidales bacterium]|nr:hypothetical protein [Dehalococcoidales bacterium]
MAVEMRVRPIQYRAELEVIKNGADVATKSDVLRLVATVEQLADAIKGIGEPISEMVSSFYNVVGDPEIWCEYVDAVQEYTDKLLAALPSGW